MFANGKTDRYVRNRGERAAGTKKPKRHRRGFCQKNNRTDDRSQAFAFFGQIK